MAKVASSNALMVVRLRGGINTIPRIKATLEHLRLNKIMHAVVLRPDEHSMGMLRIVRDYVTWGEVEGKVLVDVIKKRGKLQGDRPVTDSYVKEVTDFKDIGDFAAAIVSGKARYSDLKDVKPLFRLHPPKGGLKSTKRHHAVGGDLGYRGTAINDLISRMVDVIASKAKDGRAAKARPAPSQVQAKPPAKKVVRKAKRTKG